MTFSGWESDSGQFWRTAPCAVHKFGSRQSREREPGRRGTPPAVIAARFHKGLAIAVVAMTRALAQRACFDTVALSGGCFQNAVLFEQTERRLRDAGFTVLTHSMVPANDGGLALGQAAIAAARLIAIGARTMCLGIPAQIVRIDDAERMLATVEVGGVRRQVNIICIVDDEHPPESCVGDWVLLHVGFAMSRIDEAEAAETLRVLTELGEAQAELERDGGRRHE